MRLLLNRTVKQWTALLLGWGCIALGLLGLVLPVIPGLVLLFAGLLLLSGEYLWAHDLLQRLKLKFPTAARHGERIKRNFLHRLRLALVALHLRK